MRTAVLGPRSSGWPVGKKGDSDTRVDPLHARKMAALMQSLGGDNPVLLHYDTSAGHAGGKSVDKTIADDADRLQFLRWRLGMVNVPTP